MLKILLTISNRYIRALACLLLALAYFSESLYAVDINSTGSAYDVDTAQLVYTEQHTSTERNDGKHLLVSTYRNPKGDEICKRRVIFKNGKVVEYMLRQGSVRNSESVIRTSDSIEISVNDSAKIKQKIIPIDPNNEVVIDAGFSSFIVRNWEPLLAGETLNFDFVSVSRMSVIALQIRKVDEAQDSVEFSMTASNPIIKMMMKPIIVKYSSNNRQLAYYKGASNLKDEQGDHYQVEIKY